MKEFIQEHRQVLSHPSVSGNVFKPAARCGSSLSSFAQAGGQGTASNSLYAVCGVDREGAGKSCLDKAHHLMYGKTLDLKEDPLCLEHLYGMRKLRDHAGSSRKL